jgi:hypothetical protein
VRCCGGGGLRGKSGREALGFCRQSRFRSAGDVLQRPRGRVHEVLGRRLASARRLAEQRLTPRRTRILLRLHAELEAGWSGTYAGSENYRSRFTDKSGSPRRQYKPRVTLSFWAPKGEGRGEGSALQADRCSKHGHRSDLLSASTEEDSPSPQADPFGCVRGSQSHASCRSLAEHAHASRTRSRSRWRSRGAKHRSSI